MAAHLALCAAASCWPFASRRSPAPPSSSRSHPINDIVWLADPGPGGGGGGGGNKTPEPPRKAEVPGKEKITVPVEKKPEPTPDPPKEAAAGGAD